MNRCLLLLVASCFVIHEAVAQCLTDFKKILPEESLSAFDAYSSSVAIMGDYAVVGSPRNDSVGFDAGLVYIYKNVAGTWKKHSELSAPSPKHLAGFGRSVDLTDEYLVVAATDERLDATDGAVYVYRKPISGWASGMMPVATLRVPGASKLGTALKMDPTGSAIIAGDVQHMVQSGSGQYPSGAAYVFRKAASEWNDNSPYVSIIPDPTKLYAYYGISVAIDGEYIFIGSDTYMGSIGGAIDVFKASSDWSSVEPMATLQPNEELGYVSHAGKYFAVANGRVAAMANVYEQGIFVYVFEKGNEWGHSGFENYKIQIESGDALSYPMGITLTDARIIAAASIRGKKERIYEINEAGGTFENAGVQSHTINDRAITAGAFGHAMDTDGINLIIADPYSFERMSSSGQAIVLPVVPVLQPLHRQKLTEQINTTVAHQFGSGFLMKDDHLFVGATGDGHNAGLGAVSIYKRESGSWAFKGKIAPPFSITPDSYFGYSIAANDEYLAVTAQLYDFDGAVFIYKKKSSWSDLELVQTIRAFEEGGLYYHIGHDVALNGNTLVVSSHEDRQFKSAILFYELQNGSFLKDGAITVGKSVAAHRREISFSFHGETLAAGCITSNPSGNLLPGNVFLFEKKPGNKWDTVSMVSYPYSTNAFGYSVKLTEDHLFVSDCIFPAQGLSAAGAVMVYTRPALGWGSRQYHFEPASIVTAEHPIEGDLFGFNIDVSGNLLIAGAPQSTLLSNPVRENTNAGSTYVIQGLDFNWTNSHQLFRYQGEFHHPSDRFGSLVSTDRSEIVIGAMNESQPDAYQSGAVYIIGMPPSVEFIRPVCAQESPIQLHGYPYGGVWSGPGIVDVNGLFDPQLAGPGVHLLTYKKPNCHFEGKLELEVREGPLVTWLDTDTKLCEGQDKEILLRISASGNNNTYQWRFKGPDHNSYAVLDAIGPSHNTNKGGSYQVSVSNGACSIISPERIVMVEPNPVIVNEPPVICSRSAVVQLSASPSGGSWSGSGISGNGIVNPAELVNGSYAASYSYLSSSGCRFKRTTAVNINIPESPKLVVRGTLCDFSGALIEVTNRYPGTYSYYHVQSGEPPALVNQGTNTWDYKVTVGGNYYVTYSDGSCSATSASVEIQGTERSLDVLVPDRPVCHLEESSIKVADPRDSEIFQWWYKEYQSDTPIKLDRQSSGIVVAKTGYYKVESKINACTGTSDWKWIRFTAPDSVFVPNVFTPNLDNRNDLFEVIFQNDSEQTAKQLEIYNRNGRKIYETKGTLKWDGGSYPDGIYFWVLNYRNCAHRPISHKGLVHLVRSR